MFVNLDGGTKHKGYRGLRDSARCRGGIAVVHQLELAVWRHEGQNFVARPSLQAASAVNNRRKQKGQPGTYRTQGWKEQSWRDWAFENESNKSGVPDSLQFESTRPQIVLTAGVPFLLKVTGSSPMPTHRRANGHTYLFMMASSGSTTSK